MSAEKTFAEGYLDGWSSVAEGRPCADIPSAFADPGKTEFQTGFEHGRADALERFSPSSAPCDMGLGSRQQRFRPNIGGR